MKYHIITFGCQMNKSDSERIATLLEKIKMKHSPTLQGADLVVINMCSVRQSAVNKVISLCGKFKKLQTKNSKLQTILTGCILKTDKDYFAKKVDHILDIKSLAQWPKLLKHSEARLHRYAKHCGQVCPRGTIGYLEEVTAKYGEYKEQNKQKVAYLPISTGCNNFCSYCVVPYTRGRETHRDKTKIIKEIKELIRKGYKKIILLGENVNNYPNFTKLLKEITALKGDFILGFLAANPHNFTDELIDEIAKNEKIEKYIHLPLQSGDNTILKKMKRPYTRVQYLKLAQKIIKKIPQVKFAVDVIVGFPGETEKQFQNTASVLKKLGENLHQAYIAKYSPRAGTTAFLLKDTVPPEEKTKREQILRRTFLISNQRRQC